MLQTVINFDKFQQFYKLLLFFTFCHCFSISFGKTLNLLKFWERCWSTPSISPTSIYTGLAAKCRFQQHIRIYVSSILSTGILTGTLKVTFTFLKLKVKVSEYPQKMKILKQFLAGSRCLYSTKMKGECVTLTKILFLSKIES